MRGGGGRMEEEEGSCGYVGGQGEGWEGERRGGR